MCLKLFMYGLHLLLYLGVSSPFCLFPLQCWQPWRRRFSGEGEIDRFILVNQAQKQHKH